MMKKLLMMTAMVCLTAATSHAAQVVVETKNTSLVLDVEKGRQPQYMYYGLRLDAQELQHLQTPRDGRMDAYPVYGMNCPAEAALAMKHGDGNMSTAVVCDSWEQANGTVSITMKDPVYGTMVKLNYKAYAAEDIIEMYPLDFEEFLWANGLSTEVIEALGKFYREETPIPAGIHVAMKKLLYLYVAVGGLPDAINAFLATNNMNAVSKAYKSILKEYRDDMIKYAPDKDKPHIRECFNSIPKQLAKENKKFQYNMVKPGGRSETYLGSLQWLEDAGIICRCYNTDITGLPMEGNAKDNVFKVYMADIGLLIEMLGAGTRADILQGNLGGFKGALFENLMADTLHKKEQNLYYFQKDSGLELDFLIRMQGECVPLEVKAKTAQAKSSKTVLAHPEKYHVKHIIKFGDYNIGRDGQLLTLPNYMQFLLDLEPEEIVLEPIDVDAVNALASEIIKE